MTKISDDYDEKHMKIKFNSVDELLLSKALKIQVTIVVTAAFHKNNKSYQQVFLDGCLCGF